MAFPHADPIAQRLSRMLVTVYESLPTKAVPNAGAGLRKLSRMLEKFYEDVPHAGEVLRRLTRMLAKFYEGYPTCWRRLAKAGVKSGSGGVFGEGFPT